MFVELIANSHQIDYTHAFQLMSCLQMNVFENTQFIFFTQGYMAGCPIHIIISGSKTELSKQRNNDESISVTEQISMLRYEELPD